MYKVAIIVAVAVIAASSNSAPVLDDNADAVVPETPLVQVNSQWGARRLRWLARKQARKKARNAKLRSKYIVNDFNNNHCTTGSVEMSAWKCKQIAKAVGGYYHGKGSFEYNTKGCQADPDKGFWYNTHHTGAASEYYSPVCKTEKGKGGVFAWRGSGVLPPAGRGGGGSGSGSGSGSDSGGGSGGGVTPAPVEGSPVAPAPEEGSPVLPAPVEGSPVAPAPEEGSPEAPAPEEGSPVAPAPEEGSPVAPEEGSPEAPIPEEGSPVAPEEGSPEAPIPEEGSPVAPEEGSPVAPEEGSPVAPEEGSPVAPEEGSPAPATAFSTLFRKLFS